MLKWEMMRENMICKEKSELLICLGGKIKDDKSQQGVDIEVELAKSVNVPVALVGTVYRCVDIAFPGNEPRTLGNLVYHIHHHQEQYFNVPINETSLQLLHIASHIDLIQRQLMPLSNSRCIVFIGSILVVNWEWKKILFNPL